eukprot:UN25217
MTNVALKTLDVVPNWSLKRAITDFLDKQVGQSDKSSSSPTKRSDKYHQKKKKAPQDR